MAITFVDTSALVALLDAGDRQHDRAKRIWQKLLLILMSECNSYMLVETYALIQRRYGMDSLRAFQEDAVPLMIVTWFGPEKHEAAVAALFSTNRRELSLVDCASMETMRPLGIWRVFSFDPHFTELGCECL